MANFKVGDVCVIVNSITHAENIGRHCTVTSELYQWWCMGVNWSVHDIVSENGEAYRAHPDCLRKIEPPKPPDEQRQELGEWELCPWQPKRERV